MSETTKAEADIRPRWSIRNYAMFIALVGIWAVFTVLTEGIFISPRNLSNLYVQTATVAILTTGTVLILVSGQIDLSLGYFLAFIGGVVGALQVRGHMGTLSSMGIAMAIALGVGCWHGYWIAYRRIPAFIVTLASQLVLRGAMLWVTRGQTQTPLRESFLVIGQGYLKQAGLFKNDTTLFLTVAILATYVGLQVRKRYWRIRNGYAVQRAGLHAARIAGVCLAIALGAGVMLSYLGISYAILIVLGLGFTFTFITRNTVFGRRIYAIGGNAEAARLSGIDIRRTIFILYVIMGGLVAVAAFVYTARLGGASTLAGGGMELDAIAAAFIGGTSVSGGIGTVPGAIVGALVMASLDNGMSLIDLSVSTQLMVKGLILLAAVWFDISTRDAKKRIPTAKTGLTSGVAPPATRLEAQTEPATPVS